MKRDELDNSSAHRTPLTERQFLDAQIAQSKAQIARCMADIKATIKREANPRRLAARHPWIVSGAAAGLGALAARYLKTRGRNRSSNGTKQASPKMKVAQSLITSILPLLVKKWLAGKAPSAASQPAQSQAANDATSNPRVVI